METEKMENVTTENLPENLQKQKNYQEQFKRLEKAIHNGFYLEAMFIAYAILEDRTESILRHAEKWDAYIKSRKGRDATIDSKIKYIQNIAREKKRIFIKVKDMIFAELFMQRQMRCLIVLESRL